MDLYIVSSPLHLFLTLMSREDHSNSLCILIDEENKLDKYHSLIDKVFKYSFYVNFRYKRISKYLRFSQYTRYLFKDFRFLRKKGTNKTVKNVYLFNDHFFGAQVYLQLMHSANVYFIEDGSCVYNQWVFKNNYTREIFYRILFGKGIQQIKVMGTHPRIESRFLLYPDKARKELQDKKNVQFTPSYNPMLASKKMLKIFDYSLTLDNRKRILFVLSRLNTYHEFEWVNNQIGYFNEHGYTCYVKSHPLSALVKNIRSEDAIYLRNDLPVEIIASYIQFDKIYGPPSSALYTIKFLFPKCKVICLSNMDAKLSPDFTKMLLSIGVENRRIS